MKYYGKTDVGRKRSVNQDTFGVKQLSEEILVAVVCDGMGGASGGGIASSIASDIYLSELTKNVAKFACTPGGPAPSVEMPRLLRRSVTAANTFLNTLSKRDASLSGMGTTLVSALYYEGILYCCNIGDSRMYHIHEGGISQVTRDHSYVQFLVDSGKMTAADARKSKNKNIITRAVGIEAQVEADVFRVPLKKGEHDYFLLCTDGLSNLLEDHEILSIIRSKVYMYDELVVKVNMLIEAANNRGGNDNITALLLQA